MAINRGCSKGYDEHMESSRCHEISKDEITHLIDAGDTCDGDDVIKRLFHPTLKLLIVTNGSEG
ncbi:putative fructokinase [Medicago truncatula]|uniref:PfkB-like carbohydrate kinase family protein, putative n=1 Tax=Medicago truncatula TaxID=3880 RepID=A0A072VJ76_MEDTR|nr:pfkB-like carbohydrate kinase family protein, putative [Medicago truncatula]RHN78988.1 putative fructokinase [Medicago truncatula]